MIRVAIVAESLRQRRELADLLGDRRRFEVIASIGALGEFRGRDRELFDIADVVLMYLATASSGASKSVDDTNAALVLLTDDDELVASLRPFRGGLALLPTTAPEHQIVGAIEAAAAGLTVLHPDRTGSFESMPYDDPLTPREREVLHMLAAGLGNKEIGARLGISDHTAKFHVSQILAKLNAGSRAEAVSIAMRRGLVPL
jgi:DNA-binding NarL/FixJ family response regulator